MPTLYPSRITSSNTSCEHRKGQSPIHELYAAAGTHTGSHDVVRRERLPLGSEGKLSRNVFKFVMQQDPSIAPPDLAPNITFEVVLHSLHDIGSNSCSPETRDQPSCWWTPSSQWVRERTRLTPYSVMADRLVEAHVVVHPHRAQVPLATTSNKRCSCLLDQRPLEPVLAVT